ncbi:hypothetical protein EJ05DRAFT_478335 [Pseudovirgaria hyperparasitica]|uniref:Uncharacterized protein n=1 Tax=Pseudovirgaria hyperparasitica TaxID=470096 RepID=A0A6A6VZN6_9PEZI|nr:uncharacterized protein EJ05DRAFT_478335 [Pseudovirgaria hyperparasitica]KAF2755316.1 hypothetical protein EJ05DRAFT_478335 [Pseudovirgaria hyperparasitica]
MFGSFPTSLAILGLAVVLGNALPGKEEDLINLGLPEGMSVEDYLNAKREISKRFDQNAFKDAIPGCRSEDDPSYATGPSKFKDGEGVAVGSHCDNGLYTPAVNRFHCWTDVYLVNYQVEYQDWLNTGLVIDCATTSSCNQQVINMNQSCTTNTASWDNAIQTQIEGKITLIKDKVDAGASVSYTHNFGGSQAFSTCSTVSNTGTCTWEDKGCHAIWKAKRNKRIFGYMRRSCNTPRDGTNMPNTEKREDGYYTVGMLDFSVVVPDNQIIGCAAKCSDLKYPDEAPGGLGELIPVPAGI